jgi:hypothetical protein
MFCKISVQTWPPVKPWQSTFVSLKTAGKGRPSEEPHRIGATTNPALEGELITLENDDVAGRIRPARRLAMVKLMALIAYFSI